MQTSYDRQKIERRGRIWQQLHAAVLTGAFPPGELLPSERELARRYGATRKTLSRALARLTGEGVLTCRPRIGYQVAPVVRNGRPITGYSIGLVWENMPALAGNQGFLTTFEQAVADAGQSLLVAASGYAADRENETIRRLQAAGMSGLIVAPARHGGRSVELERWIRDERPVVLHGHPGRWLLPDALVRRCDRVDADNADGMRQIVEFLAGQGHRAAGFVGMEPLAGSERFKAFRRLVAVRGWQTRPAWHVEDVGVSMEGGRAALAAMQRSGELPTAIVCSHAESAMPFIEALHEQGVRCPQDVSVVSFGGALPTGNLSLPQLTTINLNSEQQVREIMRLLTKQFAGIKDNPEHVRVPVALMERGSVAPPRGASIRRAGRQSACALQAAVA